MPEKKPRPLTPLELQIMSVLWDRGPSNVQEVQGALAAPQRGPGESFSGYNTRDPGGGGICLRSSRPPGRRRLPSLHD